MEEILKETENGDLLELVLQHVPPPLEAGTEPTPGPEAQKELYVDLANIAHSQTVVLVSNLRY